MCSNLTTYVRLYLSKIKSLIQNINKPCYLNTNKDILIPKEKLLEGFGCCKEQIANLLSDSKKLYESKKFMSSIALSTLAHEEVGKLNIIRVHMALKKDITRLTWDGIQ